jgi:retron-type reverse transcriptase
LKSTLTTDPALSANFNINESALKSVKLGTAAGFDGVYPKFIRNCGERTKKWLISFINDVLSSARFPKLFNRAKVIAIPKPGKDGSDHAHYRPISLLSVMYKLLERQILQCIQPLIEATTPVHQAGFRKHRCCSEQVMALTTHIEAGF